MFFLLFFPLKILFTWKWIKYLKSILINFKLKNIIHQNSTILTYSLMLFFGWFFPASWHAGIPLHSCDRSDLERRGPDLRKSKLTNKVKSGSVDLLLHFSLDFKKPLLKLWALLGALPVCLSINFPLKSCRSLGDVEERTEKLKAKAVGTTANGSSR